MKCPHCTVTVHIAWESGMICDDTKMMRWVWKASQCPACQEPIIKIVRFGRVRHFEEERTVWPRVAQRTPLGDEIPEALKADYLEACEVLPISPKASAALSRRVLQTLLQEQGYAGRDLARQVDAVVNEKNPSKVLPGSIKDSVDAIRNFGNFSAHPITDVTTLQVIEVDPDEAEWCLEIVERLFDHYYVRPAADAMRLTELNAKLRQAGKPAAKA